jgi:hypothetical protein
MSVPQVKQLPYIKSADYRIGEAFDDLIRAHDNTSKNLQNDPNGANVTPPAIGSIQTSTGSQTFTTSGAATVQVGGGVHVAITDNGQIGRAVNYFVEYDVTPNFLNPWVEHLGASRNKMISLPNGTYYMRAYSQYPAGGPPSTPITAPAPVVITNSPFPALLPSQASGTGKPSTGGGHGAGKVISR